MGLFGNNELEHRLHAQRRNFSVPEIAGADVFRIVVSNDSIKIHSDQRRR